LPLGAVGLATGLLTDSALAGVKPTDLPDIAITKRTDATSYVPGQLITYTIEVINEGAVDIPTGEIQIEDPPLELFGELPLVLGPGEKIVFRGTRLVTDKDCGPITNTATVRLVDDKNDVIIESDAKNNSDTAEVTVVCKTPEQPPQPTPTPQPPPEVTPPTIVYTAPPPAPAASTPAPAATAPAAAAPARVAHKSAKPSRTRLRVEKRGPGKAAAGQKLTYSIKVTNVGKASAKDVALRDIVPSSMSLERRAKGVRLSNGNMSWSLGALAPGRSRTVSVVARVDASAKGSRCNTAVATASNAATVRGGACTLIAALPRKVTPAVTG
jgi:uncharacterized repeat protein (TIGR01451 family)